MASHRKRRARGHVRASSHIPVSLSPLVPLKRVRTLSVTNLKKVCVLCVCVCVLCVFCVCLFCVCVCVCVCECVCESVGGCVYVLCVCECVCVH